MIALPFSTLALQGRQEFAKLFQMDYPFNIGAAL